MRCGRCKQPIPETEFLHDCEGRGLGADSYVVALEEACAKSEVEMQRVEREVNRYEGAIEWIFKNGLPVVEDEDVGRFRRLMGLESAR